MDFATRFVLNLKSYFDAVAVNVWNDFARNLLPHRKWDENSAVAHDCRTWENVGMVCDTIS
jgi:hypothetical protein